MKYSGVGRGALCVCSGASDAVKAEGIISCYLIYELSDHLEKGGFYFCTEREYEKIIDFVVFLFDAVFFK